ncbi:MAG: LysR family transcriptional regulator [Gammaproteobacteria bacterium]|nr:LysR family transcriptional regulator [Gammaproteobacteria bacterium]
MDISFIRTFLELSKTRHFGKTAQSLFITQSAVSARIRHLEENLGVKLLTRDRNNIQLTPAGVRFQRHAESIVSMWNVARQETALVDESKILLSIGGVFSLWDTALMSWLGQVRQNRTELALRVEALDGNAILSRISEGSLDMGFMFEAPKMHQMEVAECGAIELLMVSTAKELSSDQALQRDDYILVDWGTEFLAHHAKLYPHYAGVNLRVNLGRLALDQIVKFGGSAYLAQEMVAPYVNSGILHPVTNADPIRRGFFALYNTTNPRLDLLRSLLLPTPVHEAVC